MATLHDLLPDATSILALEPEELAGLALELINDSESNTPSRLHPASITSPETIGPFAQGDREQIRFAMAEGWSWLVREGLLAPTPGDNFGWHFVTRRGKKLKDREGTTAYVNSVLLPRSTLHPSIVKECWPTFMRGDYDTSVFQAFRELEIAIRDAGDFTVPKTTGLNLPGKRSMRQQGHLQIN